CCKLIHREDLFSRIGYGDLILPRKGLPFYMEFSIYTKYFILSNDSSKVVVKLKQKLKIIYEIIMFSLAILSVTFIWIDDTSLIYVDNIVWSIFLIDVLARLFISKDKLGYVKSNPFDIIAVIPFDSIFRLARFARLLRVLRVVLRSQRSIKKVYAIIHTNGLQKVLKVTVGLIFLSAIPIAYIEPSMDNYADAVWWTIVTTTTVGYGDISPETIIGRLIAIILMIFGIGLVGMVTGSIATYFLSAPPEKEKNATIEFIKQELDRHEELTSNEYQRLALILQEMGKEKASKN
ncbi:MAG: potassium channel family protein, partial [Bacillaceae bacterium]|nr:potassium channel family protein [Bacillaceae bacterium]